MQTQQIVGNYYTMPRNPESSGLEFQSSVYQLRRGAHNLICEVYITEEAERIASLLNAARQQHIIGLTKPEHQGAWVYIESEHSQLWTVGFYAPNGKWQAETDHESADSAARRVHWLNGGE